MGANNSSKSNKKNSSHPSLEQAKRNYEDAKLLLARERDILKRLKVSPKSNKSAIEYQKNQINATKSHVERCKATYDYWRSQKKK